MQSVTSSLRKVWRGLWSGTQKEEVGDFTRDAQTHLLAQAISFAGLYRMHIMKKALKSTETEASICFLIFKAAVPNLGRILTLIPGSPPQILTAQICATNFGSTDPSCPIQASATFPGTGGIDSPCPGFYRCQSQPRWAMGQASLPLYSGTGLGLCSNLASPVEVKLIVGCYKVSEV